MSKSFRIISDAEGKRLDAFLSEKLALTRSKVKILLDEGYVRVNGKIPKPSLTVYPSMEIDGEIPDEKPPVLAPEDIPLEVLYEDSCLIAINKPEGMVVHPSCGHPGGTLVNAVLSYIGFNTEKTGTLAAEETSLRPGIVHRLDKGTTGVILIARNPKTQEELSLLFKNRQVHKTYRTVVEGVLAQIGGKIEGNIGRHPADRKKMAVLKEKGRHALTGFKVLKRLRGFTYLEAYPETGRTHQIRVHLAHIGHPVVGDDTYGKKAKGLAGRPLLHAYSIAFPHPVTGKGLTISAPVPPDIEDFIKNYEIHSS